MRALALCCLCLLPLALGPVGCGGNDRRAPVEERRGHGQSMSRVYYVQRGDTLYSIAFSYGLDYRRMAAANGLGTPYTIYPGQKLVLREADPPKPQARRKPAPVAAAPATARPAPKPAPATPAASAGSKSSAAASSGSVRVSTTSQPAWRWPSSGRVIRGYSASVHKGIDIDGKRGDPVKAVAAGQVVYAGTGIVGLGALLIVKHNETYLSAYGHNSRLLVGEGDAVRPGQTIAEKGDTGTDRVKLHFEIRRSGKPVDPQTLLPRR